MRAMLLTTFAASALGASLLLPAPAAAAESIRNQGAESGQAQFFSSQNTRNTRQQARQPQPRSRITVQRRSFLDPGPELSPGEYKYREYATPYGYSAIDSALPPGQGWNRTPFNDPFDVPGRPWPGRIDF
jgi:hypothetical protein